MRMRGEVRAACGARTMPDGEHRAAAPSSQCGQEADRSGTEVCQRDGATTAERRLHSSSISQGLDTTDAARKITGSTSTACARAVALTRALA
jgi:hypothetical protein